MTIKVSDERILEVCKNSKSMFSAARELGINYKTLRIHAKRLGAFSRNQQGAGMPKGGKYAIEDILLGKHPNYNSVALVKRLLSAGLKERRCDTCGLIEWLGYPIVIELHHVDGDSTNHRLENLQFLCPNCHSVTDGWRGRKGMPEW